ncbi:MAG: hypothetical protein ACYC55_07285 [Candidatus Geothermincolia bacterium]
MDEIGLVQRRERAGDLLRDPQDIPDIEASRETQIVQQSVPLSKTRHLETARFFFIEPPITWEQDRSRKDLAREIRGLQVFKKDRAMVIREEFDDVATGRHAILDEIAGGQSVFALGSNYLVSARNGLARHRHPNPP